MWLLGLASSGDGELATTSRSITMIINVLLSPIFVFALSVYMYVSNVLGFGQYLSNSPMKFGGWTALGWTSCIIERLQPHLFSALWFLRQWKPTNMCAHTPYHAPKSSLAERCIVDQSQFTCGSSRHGGARFHSERNPKSMFRS